MVRQSRSRIPNLERQVVGKLRIDHFVEETIRVHCELLPAGQRHPNSAIRGLDSPPRYQDPARRLGIKISGILKANQEESWVWVTMEGDSYKVICRVNRLVDWLEDLDTKELRPRR